MNIALKLVLYLFILLALVYAGATCFGVSINIIVFVVCAVLSVALVYIFIKLKVVNPINKFVDIADKNASAVFGNDNWQMIKDEIDNCENDRIGELMQTVVDGDMIHLR